VNTRAKLSPIRQNGHKPRKPKGFMAALNESQRETLFNWLTKDGMTYTAAGARILKQWGIKADKGILSKFWHRYCAPRLLQTPEKDNGGNLLFEITIQVCSPCTDACSTETPK
jgi:hypothetical protein